MCKHKRGTDGSRTHEKVDRCINRQHVGRSRLTQTNSEMAFSPDAEIKEQVLVELLQEEAVALVEDLLQQQLARHQDVHVHHAAGNLQQRRHKGAFRVHLCLSIFPFITFVCVYY